MKGIILAAGRGSRMQELTTHQPKCLLNIKGKPLIEHQLTGLNACNIKNIALILGYQAEKLKHYSNHHFINERWPETNMVYSLTMADEWLKHDTCIISYSDIYYTQETISRLISADGDISITYDPNWLSIWQKRFENPLDDAETFQINEKNYLLSIGHKPKSLDEIQGQYMGLLKITPTGWATIKNLLHHLPQEQIDKISMTELLNLLIMQSQKIYATPIKEKWFEFDNQHDYKHAFLMD
jgi:choline kinase